jgi:hypothetical protein
MALGALAAVGALLAVVQLAPWKGSKAASSTTTPSTATTTTTPPVSTPAATPPDTTAPVTTAPVTTPPVTTPPVTAEKPPETFSTSPKQQRPTQTANQRPAMNQPAQQQPVQRPVQNPVQAPAQPQPAAQIPAQQPTVSAPPVDPGPSRAELQKVRESLMLLNNRAATVRNSMDSLRRSQAASGYGIGGQYTGPAGLMETYLNGAADALRANDVTAAKDFSTKAERQIDILEKLFHL